MLGFAVVTVLAAALMVGCGNKSKNNSATSPSSGNGATDMPNETELPESTNNAADDAGNAVDDAVDGAGNAVKDATDGVEDAVDDAVDGTEDAVDDLTGNEKDKTNDPANSKTDDTKSKKWNRINIRFYLKRTRRHYPPPESHEQVSEHHRQTCRRWL